MLGNTILTYGTRIDSIRLHTTADVPIRALTSPPPFLYFYFLLLLWQLLHYSPSVLYLISFYRAFARTPN